MAPEVVQGTGHSFAVDFWVFGVMVYEMLYGVTPFRGQDAKRTFEDVLYKQTKSASFYKHPLCEEPRPRVSSNAKDLIAKLLVKNEKKRLGYEHGVAEIKSHPWFRNVKWYNPTLLTHYFSPTFRPFCAVFSPFFRGCRLPGAKTERTGERWRKVGEIWGRNGRETAVT